MDMDQVYVASLMIVSQEVEPDILCLVLECRTWFFAMLIADILSTKMGTLSKLSP